MKWIAMLFLVGSTLGLIYRVESLQRKSFSNGDMTPVGKLIRPVGKHVGVGSYPVRMAMTPDGKYAVVSGMGYREFLSVIDTQSGDLVDQISFTGKSEQGDAKGLYYGLAFQGKPEGTLFVSYGARDRIGKFKVSALGKLESAGDDIVIERPKGYAMPSHPAGLAVYAADSRKLLVVNNQTNHTTEYRGSLSIIDTESGKEDQRIPLSGFPLDVVSKGTKAYVSSERDGLIDVVDVESGKVVRRLNTGAAPAGLRLSQDEKQLFVCNAGSDTVAIVDTETDVIKNTVMLRPQDARGLPSAGPLSAIPSADGQSLYVALGDMNAIAVVDLKEQSLEGYIPTGWLPTDVLLTPDGNHLLVSSAKGVQVSNPNNKEVGDRGRYIQNIIEGSVSRFEIPNAGKLKQDTNVVVACNRLRGGIATANPENFTKPPIKHVIYIVKENRTYDNVLGDLPQGNGDPSLTLFPREVTPNLHALAERFVLLDNFHVCAEVSQDGWVWSTCGMLSPYASRNTPYNYSGRGRNYDTEGSNNGVPVDLIDIPDVARPPSGYIWDHCNRHGVSFRNYGFFLQSNDPADKRNDVLASVKNNSPTKKALIGKTNENFCRYDLQYADSEAYLKHGFTWPRQMKTFGANNSPSRFTEWKREFDEFVAKGEMPQFQMVRFCCDHTSGSQANQPTTKAMVADNDYAVGQLVEAVSNSPFWKDTVICVLEDDAQNGYDHVDAHRSIAFVISPYIKQGTIDSRFYNTDSMLRTMTALLNMPPMSQYDAVASPIDVFTKTPSNMAPYRAILPKQEIICQINEPKAYRAADSENIPRYVEESAIDEDLNDIIWGGIRGEHSPRPAVKNSLRTGIGADEEDED